MAERYTNIRLVLDKIMRHPLLQDINFETAVDYTIDFMRIVGTPAIFEEKTAVLDVKEYRAELPADYYQMIQVRGTDKAVYSYSPYTFHMSEPDRIDREKISSASETLTDVSGDQNDCWREPDSLKFYRIEENPDAGYTYKIQNNMIYTSVEEGRIEISYEAIKVDEEGFPLIPDNSSFTRALELYIKKQWFTVLFDLGKITQASLQNVQQEYAWAVGDCQSEFNRLSLDKAETFYSTWRDALTRTDRHKYGFSQSKITYEGRIL